MDDVQINAVLSHELGNLASIQKVEQLLDQEISFETDAYKAAGWTAFDGILFGIFLIFAEQCVRALTGMPRGRWSDLPTIHEVNVILCPLLAFFLMGHALVKGFQLQSVNENPGHRRVGIHQAGFKTNVAAYVAALPHDFALFRDNNSNNQGQLWLVLRSIEDKLRVLAKYRETNFRRRRAHVQTSISLVVAVFLAMMAAADISNLYRITTSTITL